MVNLVLHGCIKVSILVEEVLCEVFKHLYSKAAILNLEQVKSFMATVGREYDLVTTHLLMSLARYCVTMTQLTHTLILQHREHTEEQGWSVRWRLVWDTAPAFSTVHLSLPWIFGYNRGEQNGSGQFIFSLLMRRGRAAECMLFYFFWAAVGMLAILGNLSVKDSDRRTPEYLCCWWNGFLWCHEKGISKGTPVGEV